MGSVYIVLDFESTCDHPKQCSPQEIIEFPSVVVDAKTLDIIDQIQIYVKPVHHPILTKFCTELTGITQHTVDNAVEFPAAFKMYNKWLSKYHHRCINFITCGNWDLKTMLPAQCRLNGISKIPGIYKRWININQAFKQIFNKKSGGLKGMLHQLGLQFEGRPHSGLCDSINTAIVWKKIQLARRASMSNELCVSVP